MNDTRRAAGDSDIHPSAPDGIVAPLRASAEFDLVRTIAASLGDRASGLGDDAAVLRLPHGDDCIVSVDAAVEGVHFRREWLAPHEIGYRAAAAAMSDLAAMAATPHALLLAMAVPESWRTDVAAIARGVGELAASVGASVVGGNLTAADALALTITVIGSAQTPLRRTGLRAGDSLYVTGALGGPHAALAALSAGSEPASADRARFARPVPRVAEARWLAAHGCVAAIDISDGLLADAENLATASAVRIAIDTAVIPRHGGASLADAATGGEEYELLVAARAALDTAGFSARFGIPLTRIGSVVEGAAGVVADGLARVANAAGHDHFSE